MSSSDTDQAHGEHVSKHAHRSLGLDPFRDQAKVLKFWEADHLLKPQERKQIAQDLDAFGRASASWALASSMIVLFVPTIQDRLIRYRAGKPTNLPNNVPIKAPLFKSPFKSIFLSIITFEVMMNINLYTYFQVKRKDMALLAASETPPDKFTRMKTVWDLIPMTHAPFWARYYDLTSKNASFIMRDPRTLTKDDLHKPHYIPEAAQRRPIGFGNSTKQEQTDDNSEWKHLRDINFPKSEVPESTLQEQLDEADDVFPIAEESKPKSRWDEIREGK